MEVRAWFGGLKKGRQRSESVFGIRVGKENRALYFDPTWTEIEVEIDGKFQKFKLTSGFWRECPEFRDSGKPLIRDWLLRHRSLEWEQRCPPKATLKPVGANRFRLIS